MKSTAFTKYLAVRGRAAALAKALDVSRSAVTQWRNGGIPAEQVLAVEFETGISRYDLRPDVYGRQPKGN